MFYARCIPEVYSSHVFANLLNDVTAAVTLAHVWGVQGIRGACLVRECLSLMTGRLIVPGSYPI